LKDKHHGQAHQSQPPADTQQSVPPALGEDANGQQPNAQRATSQGDDTQTKVNEQRLQRTHMMLMLIFTGALVVVTGAYAWFAGGQWQATDATLKEIRQSRKLEFRAYVGAKAIIMQPRNDNPAFADLYLSSINTGRTSIQGRAEIAKEIQFRDAPPPDDSVPQTKGGSGTAYIPNIEYTGYIGLLPTKAADEIAQKVQAVANAEPVPTPTPVLKTSPTPPPASLKVPEMPAEGKGWYVYGIISYRDTFGDAHQTKFCFYNKPGTSWFALCSTFNESN
jgi:hypothetical protein